MNHLDTQIPYLISLDKYYLCNLGMNFVGFSFSIGLTNLVMPTKLSNCNVLYWKCQY